MSQASSIEWTDATWNPVRGCHKISPGCKHCYAETFAERWRGIKGHPYEHGFDPRTAPEQLDAPLHWRKPRRVFVNSMSDLFLDEFDDEYIAAVFGVMAACPQHTFQVLTKRAERMRAWFEWVERSARNANGVRGMSIPAFCIAHAQQRSEHRSLRTNLNALFGAAWPLQNVWLGVSVESQRYAGERMPHLLATPAAVRFLSCEPLLGPVDLSQWVFDRNAAMRAAMRGPAAMNAEQADAVIAHPVQWVIAGAESGNGARRMNEDWVRSIRDQCTAAGVSFFYKQRLDGRRKVSLPMLDGRQWSDFPEVSR